MKAGKWDRIGLREICDLVNYGYTASAKHEPIGPKFLRITDIVPNRIDWASVPYCKISEKDLGKYRLEKGDIVIARTGATTGHAKKIKDNYTADDLIENNTHRIEILEAMAQAIYREWFVEFRFPGREQMPMVESELGLIPQGWAVKQLGEMCHVIYGTVSQIRGL